MAVRRRAAMTLAIGVLLVATACADVTTTALEVNGEKFDRDEINDILSRAAEESVETGAPDGTVLAVDTATLLSFKIQVVGMEQALAEQGVSVSEEDIDALADSSAVSLSESVNRMYAEVNAFGAAASTIGLDLGPVFTEMEVVLDPRYGVWAGELGRVLSHAQADAAGLSS
ncbi:MAG: hypothetical protein ACR2PK_02225 [Acidimicrobiales bacterium]